MAKENKQAQIQEDLGLSRKSSGNEIRILKSDGSFNISRRGESIASYYHEIISMPWLHFLIWVFLYYLFINFVFACAYYLIGPTQINGLELGEDWYEFFQCYFFSLQSFTTVGYGGLHPKGVLASSLAGVEALCGLLTFALITGLAYAKFAKPSAKILFSQNALITPYKNMWSVQIRTVNALKNIIMDMEATLICSITPEGSDSPILRSIPLEIQKISMFPLNWTIVHAIDEKSPLYNLDKEDFSSTPIEFLLLLKGFDESYNQQVYAKYSYTNDRLVYNAKWRPMYFNENGTTVLDLDKLNDFEPLN